MKDSSSTAAIGRWSARRISIMGLMIALSILLVYLVHVPLLPAVPFLEYDPADVPILVSGFAFGPITGLVVALLTAVLQGATVSAASGIYGVLMHAVATGTLVLVASIIYQRRRTRVAAAWGLLCGGLAMTGIMIPANYIVTPVFLGLSPSAVTPLIGYITLFNLLKSTINGVVTFLLYKKISHYLKG